MKRFYQYNTIKTIENDYLNNQLSELMVLYIKEIVKTTTLSTTNSVFCCMTEFLGKTEKKFTKPNKVDSEGGVD